MGVGKLFEHSLPLGNPNNHGNNILKIKRLHVISSTRHKNIQMYITFKIFASKRGLLLFINSCTQSSKRSSISNVTNVGVNVHSTRT